MLYPLSYGRAIDGNCQCSKFSPHPLSTPEQTRPSPKRDCGVGEEHAVFPRLFDRRQPLAKGAEHAGRRPILAAGRIGLRHLEHAQEARRAIDRASTRLLKLAPSAEPPALTPPASSFLSSRSCSCAIVVVSIRRGRFVLTGFAPEDLVLTDRSARAMRRRSVGVAFVQLLTILEMRLSGMPVCAARLI